MNSTILRASHSGSIETSELLKRADEWVRQRLTWTSREMRDAFDSCAPRDICRHLRSNGLNISPARHERTTADGRRVFRWDLL